MNPIELTPATRVGEIAANLPGAVTVLRAAGIDFCCGGDRPLAEKVERVHADHPDVPAGLAALLAAVRAEMEDHMQKEERMLFPMLLRALPGTVVHPVARMRAEHDDHGAQLAELRRLTGDFAPPEGACRSWQALYAGLRKFADDLVTHVHLENNVLFPRFEEGSHA